MFEFSDSVIWCGTLCSQGQHQTIEAIDGSKVIMTRFKDAFRETGIFFLALSSLYVHFPDAMASLIVTVIQFFAHLYCIKVRCSEKGLAVQKTSLKEPLYICLLQWHHWLSLSFLSPLYIFLMQWHLRLSLSFNSLLFYKVKFRAAYFRCSILGFCVVRKCL